MTISNLLLACVVCLPFQDVQEPKVQVECIGSEAAHSAFTDLVRSGDQLICAFREGEHHVFGADGRIRILRQGKSGAWDSIGLLEEEGTDLRDPKLSVMPDGTVMLLFAGSVYEGRELLGRTTRVSFMAPGQDAFGEIHTISIDPSIQRDLDWLWRVTWHKGMGYGVIYQPDGAEWRVHLVSTRDGLAYKHVSTFEITGRPSEATLRFTPEGEMVAMVRKDGGDLLGMLGVAKPPFKEWKFKALPVRLGGPNFIQLSNGAWVAASRKYEPGKTTTVVAEFGLDGSWSEVCALPSGGDTSYPGLVEVAGDLWVSYYSSHEGKSSIYLARLPISALGGKLSEGTEDNDR